MDISYFIFLSSGLFLGWSLGANDAANVFGTAVGSKMVRFKTAACIASFFIILGAVFGGSGTSKTLTELGTVNELAGAFMVALSAALAVYWMVNSSTPVSTTQAIVGSIVGWNIYCGFDTNTVILAKIVSTWIICPILSGCISVILYYLIKAYVKRGKIHLIRQDLYTRIGLILACAFGSYALGANNIANVMGVFVDASPFHAVNIGKIQLSGTQILFFIGGLAISCGVFTYSKKIIKTIGTGVMSMSPIIAWIVVISQSIVLFLFASQGLKEIMMNMGLAPLPLVPVSSSQAVIGAVIGIGIAKGGREVNWSILGKVALGWVTTPIISASICFVCLFFLENVFNLVVYH